MVESAAEHYPPGIYNPPANTSAPQSLLFASAPGSTITSQAPTSSSTPTPIPNSNSNSGNAGGSINLRAGGYELSVGGAAGSGLYRTTPDNAGVGATFEIPKMDVVAGGIMDGAGRLWGNVRQKVEERVSRTGTPQGGR